MKKFIVILLTIFLFCNTQVFAKRKKSSRHRRAGGKYTKLKSNGFNINSETVGMDLNLNKIKPQNSAEQNISMTCGVPADINNNLAKRKCALVIAEGLKRFCTSFYGGESGYNDCSSKIKVQFKFNMGLPQLEGIKETIGDKECKGEELQKFCSNFEEELINGLWDIFSKPVIRKRKYCNFAKAKFYAAQECFRYIQ